MILVQTPLSVRHRWLAHEEEAARIDRWTYDFCGLKDGAEGNTDDENDSHAPVNGGMVERIELSSQQCVSDGSGKATSHDLQY